MPNALVTGAKTGGTAVTAALRRRAFDVCLSTCSGPMPALDVVDCYVQMPWDGDPAGTAWPPETLASRLDLLALVAPSLRPRATVLLAVEEDQPIRFGRSEELLRAFAMVVLEDLGRADAQVVVLPASELCGPDASLTPTVEHALVPASR